MRLPKGLSHTELCKKYIGKEVTVVSAMTPGMGFQVGTKAVIENVDKRKDAKLGYMFTCRETSTGYAYNVYEADLSGLVQTIEHLEQEAIKAAAELALLKDKVEFCKKNNLKEFDETEFKVFQVMGQLASVNDRVQTAREIMKIFGQQ